jgi:threonine/homoserine/homoserine lactone efflux protein
LWHTASAARPVPGADRRPVIALAGAGYLIYLAVRTLRAPLGADHGAGEAVTAQTSMWRIYLDGALVNLLNPKVTHVTATIYLSLGGYAVADLFLR